MPRTILTIATTLCLLAPALAQQGAGLPGSPVLPGSSSATVNTATPSQGSSPTIKEMGLAVASYLGDLVTEDPTLEVGAWYAIGNYPGFEVRFETRRLGVNVNQGIGDDAPHRRQLRFADLIDDKVIIEFRQDAERFRGDSFQQTDLTAGYRFDTAMPLEARFETKLFHDSPSETGYDRYRAVLQAEAFDFGDASSVLRGKFTMRVGLERASIDGHGATRMVAGQRLEAGLGDPSMGSWNFYVDLESSLGGYDGGGTSRGLTTALGSTLTGARDAWQLGYETASVREKGLTDRALKIRRHRLFGELAVGSGFRLDAHFDLLRVKNTMTPGFPTRDTRFRSGLGVGYKWLHAGTEIGQDLDGAWRPRVTAGVRIPLGGR